MPEVANDPFPRAWERIKHTLGIDYSAPTGGVECLQHALGIVPFFRDRLGAAMSYASSDK